MWDDEFEDLDENDWPLIDIEIEEDGEEEGGSGRKKVLKILLYVLLGCAVLCAAFFLIRHFVGGRSGRDSAPAFSVEPTAAPPVTPVPQVTEEPEEAAIEVAATPTPVPTPTPTPVPTAPPIPEQYVIPGVDAGDLDAVHAYIQGELDAIAADYYCPNIETITANEDCTVFTVVCNSVQESLAEQEAVQKMYEFGRMYAAYAGTTADDIRIDYRNLIGDLLWSRDSKDATP